MRDQDSSRGTQPRLARALLTTVTAALLALGTVPAASAGPADPIVVPDAGLMGCIRDQLGLAPGDPDVTEGQASTITSLYCYNLRITDLSGIEFLTGLTAFEAHRNSISDLTPLTSLTSLHTVVVSNNNVSDLSPLASMANLTSVGVSANNVTDLSPLFGLSLDGLAVSANPLADINQIATFTNLTYLAIQELGITDLSLLSALPNLESLYLDRNGISSVAPLSSHSSLKTLFLDDNAIADLSPLSALTLTTLSARDQEIDLGTVTVGTPVPNPVIDLLGNAVTLSDPRYDTATNTFMPTGASGPGSPVPWRQPTPGGFQFSGELTFAQAGPPTLITIADPALRACVNTELGQAPNDPITDTQAASINWIACATEGVADLTGIQHLTGLTILHLAENDITDISLLPSLTNLEHLTLDQNPISDVTLLSSMTQLKTVSINGLGLTDLTFVSGLTNLHWIFFEDNEISDLTPLSGLTAMLHIDGDLNKITDVRPLAPLTSLLTVSLRQQLVELGEFPIGTAVPNPIFDNDGSPIVLNDSRYDAISNTFTPTGAPGPAPSLSWDLVYTGGVDAWSGGFSGELLLTQAAPVGAPATPSGGSGLLSDTGLDLSPLALAGAGLLLLTGIALVLLRRRPVGGNGTGPR